MTKLSAFRTNSRAIAEGEWVPVPEYGDLEILTRGFGDQYADAMAMRQRRAAVGFNGDTTKLPAAIRRRINIECLIEFVLRDVRNLTHDDETPIDFAEFCELLRNPDYEPMVVACLQAASLVGQRQRLDIEEAAGPLVTHSAGLSNGAAIQPS